MKIYSWISYLVASAFSIINFYIENSLFEEEYSWQYIRLWNFPYVLQIVIYIVIPFVLTWTMFSHKSVKTKRKILLILSFVCIIPIIVQAGTIYDNIMDVTILISILFLRFIIKYQTVNKTEYYL